MLFWAGQGWSGAVREWSWVIVQEAIKCRIDVQNTTKNGMVREWSGAVKGCQGLSGCSGAVREWQGCVVRCGQGWPRVVKLVRDGAFQVGVLWGVCAVVSALGCAVGWELGATGVGGVSGECMRAASWELPEVPK